MKKWLKRGLLALAFLATLIVLFYAEEDWRGARELARVKKELEAKGESLDPKALIPPPIPDEINVAAAPVFAELYEKIDHFHDTRLFALLKVFPPERKAPALDMRTFAPLDCVVWTKWLSGKESPAATPADVLAALEKYRPLTDEVASAVSRPGVRWPVTSPDNPMAERLPYVSPILKLSQLLQVRARAEIEAGRSEAALQDIVLSLRLAEVGMSSGYLVNCLLGISCEANAFAPLTEGLHGRIWAEDQLCRLDATLARLQPCADLRRSIRWERLGMSFIYGMSRPEQVKIMGLIASMSDKPKPPLLLRILCLLRPRGWMKRDESYGFDWIQRGLIDPIDADRGLVNPAKAEAIVRQEKMVQASFWMKWTCPISLLEFPPLAGSPTRAAYTQARIGELRIAGAIERYRLKTGKIPEALDVLVPDFLPVLPVDPIDGVPLHYVREGDGYLLYSIGWNQKDDHGAIVRRLGSDRPDLEQGDWTWASLPDLYKFVDEKAP